MKARFTLARMLPTGLLAAGFVMGLSAASMAATSTWTTAGNGAWNTAGNWGGGVPTSTSEALFNQANNRTVTVATANTAVGAFTFGPSTGINTFSKTGSGSLLISGTGLPSVGITNNSGKNQSFQADVNVGAVQTTFTSTGAGSLTFSTLNLGANELSVSGATTIASITGSTGGKYVANGGLQTVTGNITGISTFLVSSGTATTNGNGEDTDMTAAGGTWQGGTTLKTATVGTNGALDLSSGGSLTLNGIGQTYTQTAGVAQMQVGYSGTPFYSQVDATGGGVNLLNGYTLAGGLSLDGSLLGSSTIPYGTTWNLFEGVNFVSGSAAPANAASNFSQFTLTAAGSPYAGTFTQYGQEWIGQKASDGTYLVFQAASGNLVVVPEPSTIVFAGLGVAMSGWTMWKKRRLSQVLAAKVG